MFTKHELLRDVWGFRCDARTRTLDSHACRLRAKLSAAGDRRWIENVWGVGYRLVGVDPDAPRRERGMRRAPLRRSTPLRSAPGPARQIPLRRTPLRPGPWRKPSGGATNGQRTPFGASEAQRREDRRRRLRRVPTDEGHHARTSRAALARRLRSPRLRRPAVLAAPPGLRHRASSNCSRTSNHSWRAEVAHAVQSPRADRGGAGGSRPGAADPNQTIRREGPASRHATHLPANRSRQPRAPISRTPSRTSDR